MKTPSDAIRVMLFLLAVPTVTYAADEWQVGTAPSFSSGRYGTNSRTEVLHTPITARRLFRDADLTLVFPVTCIWGSASVTVVNGVPVRTERLQNAASTSGTTTTRGTDTTRAGRTSVTTAPTASATVSQNTSTTRTTLSTCGLGDVVVRGRYYVLDEHSWMPTVAVRAHVKTPTASAERGLGTGRPDEGIGVEISRTLGRGSIAMLDGGYTIIGEPAGVAFDNNWWYDVGVGQNIGGEALTLSAFFSESRAIVPGLANARDIMLALNVKGASGWRLQISGQRGLSDGAPDHGVTVGAARRF